MAIIFGDGGAFTILSGSGEGNLAVAGNLTSSAVVESNLSVSGTLFVTQKIEHAGDNDTFMDMTDDNIFFKVGNVKLLELQEASVNKVVVGNGGDVDFQVKTNGNNNTIFAEGSSDFVGIGTNTVTHRLTVAGGISGSSTLDIVGAATLEGTLHVTGAISGAVGISGVSVSANDKAVMLASGEISGSGPLNIVGAATLESTLNVTGAITTAAGITASVGVSGAYGNFNTLGINDGGTNNVALGAGVMITTGYFEISEMTAPGNPDSNKGRLYVADDSGTTKLFFKDSAGTATNLLAGGSSTVSAVANGANNRVATFSSSDALNGESNLRFDGTSLVIAGQSADTTCVSASGDVNIVGKTFMENTLNVTGAITTAAGVTSSAGVTASYGHFNNVAINDGGTKGIRLQSNGQAFINGGGKLSLAGGISGQTTLSSSGDANIVGKAYFEDTIHVSGAISGAVGITGSSLQINDAAVLNPNGSATFAGSLRGKILYYDHFNFDYNGTDERFVPMDRNPTENSGDASQGERFIVPFDGRVAKILIRTESAAGNPSIIRLYKATDGTERPSTTGTNEQAVVDLASAHTTETVAFSGSSHFSAGDVIALSTQFAAAANEVNITVVFEYDTNT